MAASLDWLASETNLESNWALEALHTHQAVALAPTSSLSGWVTRLLEMAGAEDAAAADRGCKLLAETLMQLTSSASGRFLKQIGEHLSRLVKRRVIGRCKSGPATGSSSRHDVLAQTLYVWQSWLRRATMVSAELRRHAATLVEGVAVALVAVDPIPVIGVISVVRESIELFPGAAARTLAGRASAMGLKLLGSASLGQRSAAVALLVALNDHGGLSGGRRDTLVLQAMQSVDRILQNLFPGLGRGAGSGASGAHGGSGDALAVPFPCGSSVTTGIHVLSGLTSLLRACLQRAHVSVSTCSMPIGALLGVVDQMSGVRGNWDGVMSVRGWDEDGCTSRSIAALAAWCPLYNAALVPPTILS